METTIAATAAVSQSEFDLTGILPGMEEMLGYMAVILRILVLVGPIALLVLGLFYFFRPVKEPNWNRGYRFRYGMSGKRVWRFMQWLAGLVFGGLGLVLTVVMGLLCLSLGSMEAMAAVDRCAVMLLWELGLVIAAVAGVNITVMVRFDRNGVPRIRNK